MLTKRTNGVAKGPRLSKALTGLTGGAVDRRTFLKRSGLAAGGIAAVAGASRSMVQKAKAQAAAGAADLKRVRTVCNHCAVGCTVEAEVDKGVWVGQIGRTGEQIVVKGNGDAIRCRTVRRVPIETRWNPDKIFSVVGTPRLPAPSKRNPHAIDAKRADEEPAEKDGQAQRGHHGERRDEGDPELAEGRP
ncbi:MAG: twin-arginine translocation signal domain-containing protein, partial [Alphaproteobacteria bacterium]|nr:twin-arginine translocation signal domain-containing protein [Alphaproteobacteria bacterium]